VARGAGIGTGFGRLWSGSTTGNLGDGITRVAIGLFAAALTRDPFAVAIVTALTYLPGLLLGVPIGALVDRYDRRRFAVVAGALRVAALLILVVAALSGQAELWLLYTVVFLLYTCETVYDTSVSSMVPMVVADRDHLERANGRLQGGRLIAENFIGPPLAGMLFALAATYAFGASMACYLAAALLLMVLPGKFHPRGGGANDSTESDHEQRRSLWRDIKEGVRYLFGHSLHRSLLILMMAVYFGTAMVNATNVLWTLDVLGVSEALFGVFTLTLAAGALLGSQTSAFLTRRLGRAPALWATLAGCGLGGLIAAATTSPYVAGVGLIIVGWASMAFGIVNLSLRQRLTPTAMLGRVNGTYWAAILGVMVVGAAAGGALASAGGLRLPWAVFGTALLAISAAASIWLPRRVIDREVADTDTAAGAEAAAAAGTRTEP
jgi:MFS family permease